MYVTLKDGAYYDEHETYAAAKAALAYHMADHPQAAFVIVRR